MIAPYYSDEQVTIYHGDCREILPTLGTFDVAITDPPYGIDLVTKTSDYRHSRYFDNGQSLKASTLYSDQPDAVRHLLSEVIPTVLAKSDRAVIFPGPTMLWHYPHPRAIGCVYSSSGPGRCAWGFQCMHPILYYGRDPYLVDGNGGRPNSFSDIQPNREPIDHPCPKPLHWMHWAVARATRPGELVIDPFAGSGTTLRAAKNQGRRAIGIEIEERYCEIAAERMGQEVLALDAAGKRGDQ